MRKLLFIITIFISLFSTKFSYALGDDIDITIVDITKDDIIGYSSTDPDAFLYEFLYTSPGFATQRQITTSNNFTFPKNETDIHSIYLIMHIRIDGITYKKYKEFIITEITHYDGIMNYLNCYSLVGNEIFETVPFAMQQTNPDYDACALCNYITLAMNHHRNDFTAGGDYFIIDTDVINEYCHHDLAAARDDLENYDYCATYKLSQLFPNRLANPNTTKTNTILPAGSVIKVYNLQGGIVSSTQIDMETEYNPNLIMKNLNTSAGIYIMHITSAGKEIVHEKIVL